MTDQAKRIALFIDFDNGQLNIHYILEALRERGILLMKRAYGDWERFSRFKNKLAENGVELIERPPIYSADKNGADITLAVEAMEACLLNPHIEAFAIVSGDSDFLPLISRLQAHNKTVIVIAKKANASNAVIRNCNEYISYDNLVPKRTRKPRTARTDSTKPEPMESGDGEDLPWLQSTLEGAFLLLRRAVELLEDLGGEARSSVVKQKMTQMSPSFSEKDYGFNQYRDFLDMANKKGYIRLGKKVEGSYLVALGESMPEAGEEGVNGNGNGNGNGSRPAPEPRPRREDRPAPREQSPRPARPTPEPAAVISDPEGLLTNVADKVGGQDSAEIFGFGLFAWEERRDRSGLRLRFRPSEELVAYLNNDLDGDMLDTHLRQVRQMEKPDVGGLFSRLKGVLGGGVTGPDALINLLTTTARTLKGTGSCRWENVGTFRTAESTRQPVRADGKRPLYTRFYAEGALDRREPKPTT